MEPKGSLQCSRGPSTGPYPQPDISSPSPHPTALRSILILSSQLCLRLPSGLFPSGFPTEILYAFLFYPCVLHALPTPCSLTSFIPSFINGLQPFVGPWPLLQLRNNFYTDGRTPWPSDQPVARPLPTHRTTQTQNNRTYRHPGLEWDSNPRSQRLSERRQFMPYAARPLWSALLDSITLIIQVMRLLVL
jgi:hypothetical protein